jgi:two-component sensor histidine kinase
MIELQNDKSNDAHLLDDLENRINAIAKTYEMLISSDNLEEINMEEYIESLLADISETFSYMNHNIKIKSSVHATLPLKEAIYVGLIINELVTNAYKYAFDNQVGTIYVDFTEEKNTYKLIIKDTGKGFELDENSETLGIQLVKTLVFDHLIGMIKLISDGKCEYIIRFKRV